MMNYIWFICLELGFIGIAANEVVGDKIRKSKYGRAYSGLLLALCGASLAFYIAAVLFNDYASTGIQLSSLFLWANPFINFVGRRSEKESSKRITRYWVMIFVSIIAIVLRLFGC